MVAPFYSEFGSLVVARAGRPCSATYQAVQRFGDDNFEPASLTSSPSFSLASAAAGGTFCDQNSGFMICFFQALQAPLLTERFLKDSRTICR